MNILKKCFVALCFLFFLYGTPMMAQSDHGRIEKEIEVIMEQYEAIGISVVVIKDNKLIYEKAFGYNDLEENTPLKVNDIFRIASISKSFTVTALLKLIEDGKVSLQDNASDLIGFPVVNPLYPDEVITLEMILNHTSSLNDSQRYASLDVIHPDKNPTYAKSYSDYPPGATHRYSNMGFNLAGAILEKLHGKRFDLVIEDEILKLLGMEGGFNVTTIDASKLASLYIYDPSTNTFNKSKTAYRPLDLTDYEIGYTGARFSPTGGLKVSAPTLAKYMQMHMNFGVYDDARVLRETSSALMQMPYAKVNSFQDYGLGFRLTREMVEGEALRGHTGIAQGMYSAMFFEPYKKFGFVVLSNGHKLQPIDGVRSSLIQPVINALYDHFIEE